MSDMPPSDALRDAIDELRSGHGARGEELVLAAVREAEARHGRVSFEHAAALFDLGRFYTMLRDFGRAAESIRRAADLELPGEKGERDRLTYLMNLGEMLKFAGDVEGAEAVLREGLERRRHFYGPEHAGFAFGLEPLAEVVWLKGEAGAAVPLIREAVRILWDARNPQVLSALALRAFIHHAAGFGEGAFADLPELADDDVDEIADSLLFRVDHLKDKALAIPVLVDLCRWIGTLRGEHHASLIPIAAKIADCERLIGDHEGRMQTLDLLVQTCQANGDTDQAIKTL